MGVPSPWALMGAPAGRWGTRPCRVWMLLASGVWSRGGRFQNPRAPGWCRLTGDRVGPRRLRASPTRWPGSQAWGGGAPCRQAELVLEWGPLWGAAPDGRGWCWGIPKLGLVASVWGWGPLVPGAGWCWVWSALGGPGLGGAGLWLPLSPPGGQGWPSGPTGGRRCVLAIWWAGGCPPGGLRGSQGGLCVDGWGCDRVCQLWV